MLRNLFLLHLEGPILDQSMRLQPVISDHLDQVLRRSFVLAWPFVEIDLHKYLQTHLFQWIRHLLLLQHQEHRLNPVPACPLHHQQLLHYFHYCCFLYRHCYHYYLNCYKRLIWQAARLAIYLKSIFSSLIILLTYLHWGHCITEKQQHTMRYIQLHTFYTFYSIEYITPNPSCYRPSMSRVLSKISSSFNLNLNSTLLESSAL